MNYYAYILPSCSISFRAITDQVAYVAVVVLSTGKAACDKCSPYGSVTGVLPTMLTFHPNTNKAIEEYLGVPIRDFVKDNTKNLLDCVKTFGQGEIKGDVSEIMAAAHSYMERLQNKLENQNQ